jgi:hypothetical protein
VHDDFAINAQSQEEKMDTAIFSTSGIASGAFLNISERTIRKQKISK